MAIQMKKITLLKGFEFISEEPCVKTAAEEKLENFPIYNVRLNEDYQVCPYNCDGCSRQLQNGAEKLYTCSKSTKKYVLDFDDSIINVDNETLKINWEECVHYLKFDYMRYECKKTRKRLPSQWAAIGDEHVLYTYRFTAMMAFFGLEESAEYISAKLGVNVKTVKRYLYESIDQCDMDAYYDEIDTLVRKTTRNITIWLNFRNSQSYQRESVYFCSLQSWVPYIKLFGIFLCLYVLGFGGVHPDCNYWCVCNKVQRCRRRLDFQFG